MGSPTHPFMSFYTHPNLYSSSNTLYSKKRVQLFPNGKQKPVNILGETQDNKMFGPNRKNELLNAIHKF